MGGGPKLDHVENKLKGYSIKLLEGLLGEAGGNLRRSETTALDIKRRRLVAQWWVKISCFLLVRILGVLKQDYQARRVPPAEMMTGGGRLPVPHDFATLKKEIAAEVRDLKREVINLGQRVYTLEQTDNVQDEEVDCHRRELLALQDKNQELQYPLEDLDNKSR
ncbi:hypothetical protein NDU88_005458 [Pleurodeles waltl]|uniref:Uncharacterized protein n=1 Tax=Pleurodeles waltl TaxID=8319 RepID=A0AAV7WYB7_PLEWA|nr:hypothetical protein NDU88_005458 [Pleurodeles waltl]